MHLYLRSTYLALILGFFLALAGQPAGAQATIDEKAATAERSMGKADAKITVIEYASLTCPHCAHFHKDILPRIKAQFVDNGQVRIIFRDFPFDKIALSAAMLARCAPADRYFTYLSTFFGTQSNWISAPDPVKALGQTARLGGMSEAQVDACLKNSKLQESVVQSRFDAEKNFKIQSTPSFVINNGAELVEGADEKKLVETLQKLGAKPAPLPANLKP
jgi:protein-disulfide isomerase